MPNRVGTQREKCVRIRRIRRTSTGIVFYNTDMEKREKGSIEKNRETLLGTVVVIGGFLCAVLLSRVRIHGLHTPLSFGLLLGSQLAGFEPAAIVGGIILGSFSEPQPYWQGVSAALLYWCITRIVLLLRRKCLPSIRFLIYALCMIVTLPISAIYGTEELLYGMVSLAASVLSAFCFRRICLTVKTMNRARLVTEIEQGAIVLGIGTLLFAVADAAFFGWSLPVSLILLLSAVAVTVRGVFGAAAGVLWTVMLTLYTGCDPMLIGSVALGALTGAAVREKGKPFIIGAFILSGVLFESFRMQQVYLMSIPNMLSAMLLYLCIPKAWLTYLRGYADPRVRSEQLVSEAVRQTERRASRELERMGKLLGGFSGMFHVAPEEDDSVEQWTVQGALAICHGCEERRHCWKDADAMRDAIVTLAREAGRGSRLAPIGPIDENCRHFGDLCASAALSCQQADNRNAISRQAQKQFAFAERQLSGAGAALCSYARKMRSRSRTMRLRERKIREKLTAAGYALESLDVYETDGSEMIALRIRRPLKTGHTAVQTEIEQACGYPLRCVRAAQSARCVSFGFEPDAELHAAAQISRTARRSTVSGDATGECRIPGGRVCFALSDGMGSGQEARSESEAAIRLLFRLYYAGVKKELVYESVNRMLLAQNEAEMYATLDAVSIDLNTGEAELLKYGAPPSFLIRNGQVKAIFGEALPCGILAEAKPSVIRVKLKRNDRIVLCSDGVQDALTEGTAEAIQKIEDREQKPGEALLRLAQARGGSDDMTVMVIRVA